MTTGKKAISVAASVLLTGLGGAWLSQLYWLPQSIADHRLSREVRPATPGRIRFLCTGDIHKKVGAYAAIFDLAGTFDVDFVLFLGDLAHHDRNPYYHVLAESVRDANPPCAYFMVPGNHDTERGLTRFRKVLGKEAFLIDAGPLRVLCLDTGSSGRVSTASWSVVQCAVELPDKLTILAAHVPLAESDARRLASMVEFHGAFSAHAHDGFRQRPLLGRPVWEVPGGGGHGDQEENTFVALVESDGAELRVDKIDFDLRETLWMRATYWARTKPYGMSIALALGIASMITARLTNTARTRTSTPRARRSACPRWT